MKILAMSLNCVVHTIVAIGDCIAVSVDESKAEVDYSAAD